MVLSPLVQVKSYKDIDIRLTDTHTHTCISLTRHAVVHVSVIVLVGHPPPCARLTCCDHTPHSHYPLLHSHVLYRLCVDGIVWMLLKYSSLPLVSCFMTTVHNFSPRCLIIFGLILFSRPVPRTRDQTAGFYLLVYSSVFVPCRPSAHSLETGTQVTWLWLICEVTNRAT